MLPILRVGILIIGLDNADSIDPEVLYLHPTCQIDRVPDCVGKICWVYSVEALVEVRARRPRGSISFSPTVAENEVSGVAVLGQVVFWHKAEFLIVHGAHVD